jgi:hypothetical protein
MFNLSAAMSNEFVAFSEKMIAQVNKLGPNPLKMKQINEVGKNLNSEAHK